MIETPLPINSVTPTPRSTIWRFGTGQYIDVSKIISVSEIIYDEELGSYPGIYFNIFCELLEKPIVISCPAPRYESHRTF